MYLEVPIEGSGDGMLTNGGDPWRAQINVPVSAVIPGHRVTGRPLHTTTVVWVDDKLDNEVDRSIRRIPLEEGRNLAKQMDPKADLDALEQKPRGIQRISNR